MATRSSVRTTRWSSVPWARSSRPSVHLRPGAGGDGRAADEPGSGDPCHRAPGPEPGGLTRPHGRHVPRRVRHQRHPGNRRCDRRGLLRRTEPPGSGSSCSTQLPAPGPDFRRRLRSSSATCWPRSCSETASPPCHPFHAEENPVRERVKSAPSKVLLDYVLRPRLEADLQDAFGPLMDSNRAHVVMLAARGIVARDTAARLMAVFEEVVQAGPDAIAWDPAWRRCTTTSRCTSSARRRRRSAARCTPPAAATTSSRP